jgi:hypothetical protein
MSEGYDVGRRRRLGKGLAAVLATGLLLTACGGGGDDRGGAGGGLGGGTATPPTYRTPEEHVSILGWKACEVFGDHVREFAEFLEYKKFDDELFSSNGQNTAGVRLCEGRAIFSEEDTEHPSNNPKGLISIGFGTANMEGHRYHEEKYKTPTGRYDLMIQLARDNYEAGTMVERTEDGPWTEATLLLGDTRTGTTLSALSWTPSVTS